MPQTQDLHIGRFEPLVPPAELKRDLPATEAHQQTVAQAREVVRNILAGRDDRKLVIVGPCSIHDPEAALEYAGRLAKLHEMVADRCYLVMRVYFEKPRTTLGWKGLLNDPHLNGTYDIHHGMTLARRLLLDITALGLPTGTEFLDPISPQYLADLVSWAAVGARTTESQTHREMASGLSMPVGFKNSTDGNLETALNAMESARQPHAFLGIDQMGRTCVVHTTGNPDCHIVLRGGGGKPNYSAGDIAACESLMDARSLPPRIVVDCSHEQTEKDYRRQPVVLEDVTRQVRDGNTSVVGFMLESHLHAGNQKLGGALAYGVSITDGCIDWAATEQCLIAAARALTPVGS